METQELTQIVTAHQNAIARGETRLDRIEAAMEQSNERLTRIEKIMEGVAHQTAINQESIASLTASILDLRNLVADYIQSRTKTE